jgi:hypothetical protein
VKELKLKTEIPQVPGPTQRKYNFRLAPVGVEDDTREKLSALRDLGVVEADVVRAALREYLKKFFEEIEV